MPRLFFLFIFSISLLFADDFDAIYQATVISDPSALVEGCVNAITGGVNLSTTDVVINGKEPLSFERSYVNVIYHPWRMKIQANSNENLIFEKAGWSHLQHTKACFVDDKPTRLDIYDPNGGLLRFKYKRFEREKKEKERDFQQRKKTEVIELPFFEGYRAGYVNTSRQAINARSNIKNTRAIMHGDKDILVIRSDGTKSYYHRDKGGKTSYYLTHDELLNGNKIHYYYDKFKNVTEIKTTNPSGSREYAKINFAYEHPHIKCISRCKKDHRYRYDFQLQTKDSRKFTFKHTTAKEWVSKTEKNDDDPPFFILDNINSKKYFEKISYYDRIIGFYPLLKDYIFPNERKCKFKYYFRGNKNPEVGSIEIQPSDDPREKRVSALYGYFGKNTENYSEEITHRFFYDEIANLDKNRGSTRVEDALGNLTIYRYSDRFRLERVQKYQRGIPTPYNQQVFIWGPKEDIQEGFLYWQIFLDKNNAIKAKRNSYDNRGNVLHEILYGNISGKSEEFFSLNSSNVPIVDNLEKNTKSFSYTPNDLLKTELHQNGLLIEYSYHNNNITGSVTDLPSTKFVYYNNEIKQRTFYKYDNDNILIKQIQDDGSFVDENDLKNITRKLITKIKPRDAEPYGLPDNLEEYYWNFDEGQEELLRKEKYVYSPTYKVIKKTIFDANDDEKYTLEFDYDENDNLIFEKDAVGRTSQYQYDINNNKTYEKDVLGKETFFVYDLCNRLIEKRFIYNGKVYLEEYEYDKKHNKIAQKDSKGNIILFTPDAAGNIVETKSQSKIEDTYGNKKDLINYFSYDGLNRQVQKTDPLGYTTTTKYNIFDKPTLIVYPDGTKEENIYNLDGTLNTYVDQEGTQTKYEYDYKQRVSSKKIYSPENDFLQEELFEYNAFDLISKTDAERNITKDSYDGAGRKIKEEFFSKDGQILSKKELFYGPLGFVEKEIEADVLVTIYVRDEIGRVKEKLNQNINGKLLSQIKYEYDDRNNKKEIKTYVTIVEEKDGEKVKKTQKVTEKRLYDIFGRLIKTIDSNGKETNIIYDDFYKNSRGETVKQKNLENALHQKIITTYDILDREKAIEHLNPHGKTVAFEEKFYDLNGNLTRQVSSLYSDSENTPKKVTTLWKYDSMNRLILLTEAYGTKDEKITEYTYRNSKINTLIKPDQTILKYSYDYLGNNTKLESINTSNDLQDENLKNKSICYQFSYNKLNQLIEAQDINTGNKTTRKFDAKNNLLEEHQESGLVIKNEYDLLSNKTKCVFPDSSYVQYQYDPMNLTKVIRTQPNGKIYEHEYLEYDLSLNLIKERLIKNSGDIDYELDKMGRIANLKTPYHSQSIVYDDIGRISKITWEKFFNDDNEYSYDDLNQIKSETGHFSNNYENDSHFNRLKKNESFYEINDLNEILSTDLEAFEYDENGNLIARKSDNEEVLFYYDDLDRLIKVEKPNDYILKFKYDPFNRRISRKVLKKSSTKWKENFKCFLYEDQNEIGSFDEHLKQRELRILSDSDTAEIGSAIAFEIDGYIYAPIYDISGNVISLIYNGSLYEHYRYSVFGERKIYSSWGFEKQVSQINNPWQFSSKRIDEETNLIYYGRRYYDPLLGRWLTPDPKGFVDGLNLYAFVSNNPLTNMDLYGLMALIASPTMNMMQDPMYFNSTAAVAHQMANFAADTAAFGAHVGFGISSPFLYSSHFVTGKGSLGEDFQRHLQNTDMMKADVQNIMQKIIPADQSSKAYQNSRMISGATLDGIMLGSLIYGGYSATANAARNLGLIKNFKINNINAKPLQNFIPKERFQLNRFHQNAKNLSEVGQNNIRILRGWAKSKGWRQLPNQSGTPEKWGVLNGEHFQWRLIIKPEASMRVGLESGSNLPRFDARLNVGGKQYINPFTGRVGEIDIGTHLPIENIYH